jgi:hypothetical protein
LQCGKSMTVCPTGRLAEGQEGYRVQLGASWPAPPTCQRAARCLQ